MAFMVLLSIMMMGGLFLLLFGGVGFRDKKTAVKRKFEIERNLLCLFMKSM